MGSFIFGSFVCQSFAGALHKDPHSLNPVVQKLLSNYRNPFTRHILATRHDCITVQSFLSRCRFSHALCKPPATQNSFFCTDVWRFIWRPFSYFIFLIFSPSSVCFISIHRAYPHSQTYFRSKLTQPPEAPYPNMGSGISLCFFCPPVCIARMIS